MVAKDSQLESSGNAVADSSFKYAIALIPQRRRTAIRVLYQFCRELDEIVDNPTPNSDPLLTLNWWRQELEQCYCGISSTQLSNELVRVIREYDLPKVRFEEIISGMEHDITHKRYETFAELEQYCYLVASAVGLLCIEVLGYRSSITVEYAKQLGIGLQLTNIIRDVFEDSQRGRIYIPLEDFDRFSYSEESLNESIYDSNFIELMRFQSQRAWEVLRRCSRLLPPEDQRTLLPAEVMRKIYETLLHRIQKARFDVFKRTITVPQYRSWSIASSLWFQMHMLRPFYRFE